MLSELVLAATSLLLFHKTRIWSFVALAVVFVAVLVWRPLYWGLVPALAGLVLETLKRLKNT